MTTDLVSGFAILPAVVDPRELGEVAALLSASPQRTRAGARHLLGDPLVSALARDPCLAGIATGVLGESAIPFRATLFDKSATANWLVVWHQDTALPMECRHDRPGWGTWSTKAGVLYAHAPADALERVVALRLHLDESTSANGPLRVLPGSHRMGVLTDAGIGELKARIPAVDCLVGAGGIVAMRPLIVHASSKSETTAPRRVLHVEYAASLEVAAGARLALA